MQQALGPRSVRVFNTIIPRSAVFKDVANARTVLAYSNPRNRYTEYYRRLLAEILEVIGGRAAGQPEPSGPRGPGGGEGGGSA